MNQRQKQLARYALGLADHTKTSCRNRFHACPNTPDHEQWSELVGQGLACVAKYGHNDCFWLTPEGAALALNEGETLGCEDFPAKEEAA